MGFLRVGGTLSVLEPRNPLRLNTCSRHDIISRRVSIFVLKADGAGQIEPGTRQIESGTRQIEPGTRQMMPGYEIICHIYTLNIVYENYENSAALMPSAAHSMYFQLI